MVRLLFALLVAAMALPAAAQADLPDWHTPVVEGVGPSVHLPGAAVPPDTSLTYRLVFDVIEGGAEGKAPLGLIQVARTLNSFALYGMTPERMEIVAVLHGPATAAALGDAAHRAHVGGDNPALGLVRRLRELGVEVFVCGNALTGHGYATAEVADEVTVATSALAVVSTYQLRGYALMAF
ncbi:DsrE family protein [Rubrivirga sp. IMCC43871]|uniref:DsrE family protein n=1 Tax=Rubrivirga sp. IMCC43871 TaxID=3391575 RepID=UPI003990179F